MRHHWDLVWPFASLFWLLTVGITGGQEDFFTMNPHLLNGIDVSQVQDIDRVDAIDLPTVTDSSGKPLFTGLYSGPYFDLRTMAKNQTVQIGENALIHCAVKQVGEKSVSWIRKSDSYILSVDSTIFISDDRFKVLRPVPSTEWNLHLKSARKTDEGLYECQISTEPKMSYYIYLRVVVPVVRIEGGPDIHAQAGSSVTLKCSVIGALNKPTFVKWYLDGSPLPPDWQVFPITSSNDIFDSSVRLARVDSKHSGQYECQPSKLQSAIINLHVVKGGTLAAMSDDRQAEAASSGIGAIGSGGGSISSGGLSSLGCSSKLALSSVFLAFTATKQLLLSLIFLGDRIPSIMPHNR